MIFVGFAILLSILPTATSGFRDTLNTSSPLYDGETLISAGGIFALGFFSPENRSDERYVAIWYHKISSHDVVWVANARSPVGSLAGSLALTTNGTLLVFDHNNTAIWSSPSTANTITAVNPTAQLLDTGNLIVRDAGSINNCIWQSFDYPSNTMLAGMLIGWDLRTGLNHNLTSWANPTDPSAGEYTAKIDLRGVPQFIISKGHILYNRGGPWIGHNFAFMPEIPTYLVFINVTFVTTTEKLGYSFEPVSSNVISMLRLNPDGTVQRLVWIDPPGQWGIFFVSPKDQCDEFSLCGPFGTCNTNDSPYCSCLRGFRPKNPGRWVQKDWRDGCMRNRTLDCRNGTGTDRFVTVSGVKLPDTSAAVAAENLGSDECRLRCLTNCSCTAYSLAGVRGRGRGCIMWTGELIDIRVFATGGLDLFLRVSATDAAAPAPAGEESFVHHNSTGNPPESTDTSIWSSCFWVRVTILLLLRAKGKKKDDGEEIAVKRLSKSSKQGAIEFKNELMSIAKLQHRNLVLLLGCCIQRHERILIYEYMENKSLDTFLFDKARKVLLNWKMRYSIIIGIARGLLYLHQDSAVRVIHRDLKASNILLNQEMVPKISDFGLARIFKGDEAKSETKRVVGTYGYMSPEYVIEGIFSAKSDVFSFGVIVLEVISNQRNGGFSPSQSNNHLIEQAWSLWNEGKALELVDESISNSYPIVEVLRCIQVGLLCVQEHTNDRPLMSSVILMLTSDNEVLPKPKHPGFVARRHSFESNHSSLIKQEFESINEVSLTMLHGR